jgi:poly(3-hydroxybutyrate) depolymerase
VGQAGGLIAALVSLTAAVAGSAAAVDFTLTIPHGGLTRTALVHVPTGAGDPRPVVLNLHGGGNAESHRRWTRMDAAADRRGFVAVYPNGTGPTSGRLLVWNAGTCCGRAPAQGVDDVGFPLRTWRSGWPPTPPALVGAEGHTATLGPPTKVIDANEEMWKFFERFARR